jgi:exoribonuclease R
MRYKLVIQDNTYTSWKFEQCDESAIGHDMPRSIDQEGLALHPMHQKWFHGDQFTFLPTPHCTHSPTRNAPFLCGVLILEGNKTYGRTANKKRLLYRVIPASLHLPSFLIPYDMKPQFVKANKNKYILFRFDAWIDKHPTGLLHEVLGDVDQLEVFFEYQLYSKCLNSSLKELTHGVHDCTKKQTIDSYIQRINTNDGFHVENRSDRAGIISIDPPRSVDYDDALDIHMSPGSERVHITVYVANVFVWLETFQLWHAFSNRVATVYLPDRRRPMLPTQLSDAFCSLKAQEHRFAFAIDFELDLNGHVVHTSIHTVMIRVHRNYTYGESALDQDPTYQQLQQITKAWNPSVTSSHEVVAHWMLEANKVCAQYMYQKQTGIFRTVKSTMEPSNQETNGIVPRSIASEHVLQQWMSCSGQYEPYRDALVELPHLFLQTPVYAQVTSPIRRLVDLLNQMMMMSTMGIALSQEAISFMDHWLHQMPYVNASMRSIRKIQTDCSILHRCLHQPELLLSLHPGIVFDKIQKQNGLFGYMVYLEDCKLLTRLTTSVEIENHSACMFRIFLFETAYQTKKKIRVEWVTTC